MTPTHYNLLVFVSMSMFVTTMAKYGLHIHDNADKHDAEFRLQSDLQLGYNTSRIAPPHNKTSPITVNIGLDLLLITDLNARSQTLTTEMWLKLHWKDKRFAWDPTKYENITDIRVNSFRLWQPDIKLINAATIPIINSKGSVKVILENDGSVWYFPPLTFFSICTVNLKYYPYDKHTCYLKFASWTMDGDDIDLRPLYDDTLSLDNAYNEGGEWEAVSSGVAYSRIYYECCEEPYPDVEFNLVLRRRSPFYKLAVMFPVAASVVIAVSVFCLSPISQLRITLNALALLLLVLELTHLSNKVPPVGSSPPVIVSFCGITVVLVASSTVFTASVLSYLRNPINVRSIPSAINKFVGWRPIQMISMGVHGSSMFGPFKYSQDEEKLDATDAENPFDSNRNGNYEEWLHFFQIVDRIVFGIFSFIAIVVLIVTSF